LSDIIIYIGYFTFLTSTLPYYNWEFSA